MGDMTKFKVGDRVVVNSEFLAVSQENGTVVEVDDCLIPYRVLLDSGDSLWLKGHEVTHPEGATQAIKTPWDGEDEVCVTDPSTGGKKGVKEAELGALDPAALYVVARAAGMGTRKYGRGNFLQGYKWSQSYDALQRHLLKWQCGENIDPESGHSHLAHAAWHCLTLLSFQIRGLGTDDRYPSIVEEK